jgi:hypothetical protein
LEYDILYTERNKEAYKMKVNWIPFKQGDKNDELDTSLRLITFEDAYGERHVAMGIYIPYLKKFVQPDGRGFGVKVVAYCADLVEPYKG